MWFIIPLARATNPLGVMTPSLATAGLKDFQSAAEALGHLDCVLHCPHDSASGLEQCSSFPRIMGFIFLYSRAQLSGLQGQTVTPAQDRSNPVVTSLTAAGSRLPATCDTASVHFPHPRRGSPPSPGASTVLLGSFRALFSYCNPSMDTGELHMWRCACAFHALGIKLGPNGTDPRPGPYPCPWGHAQSSRGSGRVSPGPVPCSSDLSKQRSRQGRERGRGGRAGSGSNQSTALQGGYTNASMMGNGTLRGKWAIPIV